MVSKGEKDHPDRTDSTMGGKLWRGSREKDGKVPGAAGRVQGEELECMVISSGSRSKRLSSSISLEVVAEVRNEGQNQENSSEKTGRGCREGIMLVVE